MNRENYTYQTYKKAFYGEYQYVYPLYDQINKPIYDEIENNQQIQSFNVNNIKYSPKQKVWIVSGILARCISPINQYSNSYQCTIKKKKYKIEVMNGKLIVLNSRNG